MTELPIFITGNQNKADYLSRQLGISLEHRKLELIEPQTTDLQEIVKYKLEQAYDIYSQPVLVEDVSLEFNALNGLPGPYIKWFEELAGDEACCRMLDGFDDRTAVIRCCFGYFDGVNIKFFDSELHGTIATSPRGENGFGFDRYFIHNGDTRTRAEMSQEENERTYAELMKPFNQVKEFLNTET
jgi:inosine triphosphate pyrophosphatase